MTRNERFRELAKWTRPDLVAHYMRGVVQPNGNLRCGAGPVSAYRGWRKDELVNSILDLEFPEPVGLISSGGEDRPDRSPMGRDVL